MIIVFQKIVAFITKYFTKIYSKLSVQKSEPEMIEEAKPIKTKRYYPKKKKTSKNKITSVSCKLGP